MQWSSTEEDHTHPIPSGMGTRTSGQSLEGQEWGSEEHRGYIYHQDDTNPPLVLKRSEWLKALGDGVEHMRDLFSRKQYENEEPITP